MPSTVIHVSKQAFLLNLQRSSTHKKREYTHKSHTLGNKELRQIVPLIVSTLLEERRMSKV